MAGGATGEPTAKRAKADGADEEEEEDPLVRRRNELILEVANARSEGTAKEDLRAVCATLEAKNQKNFGGRRLPREMWQKIFDEYLHQNDLLALAMTCRFFRKKQKDLRWKLETNLRANSLFELRESGKVASHTLGWFQWACDTMEILPGFKYNMSAGVRGTVYEGDLVNYAVFQGSVKILRWLMEEKGWEPNEETGFFWGGGGSVEVLEYLEGSGYEFDERACHGAAQQGHLEALKWLRDQDPPCPWDEWTFIFAAELGHLDILKWARSQDPPCPWHESACSYAAERGQLDVLKWARSQSPPCPWDKKTCYAAAGGHLDVLEWARSQSPPCPWDKWTCSYAARGGHLEILKWLRAQNPPCPWSKSDSRKEASWFGHQHIIKWIDQQEDESDAED